MGGRVVGGRKKKWLYRKKATVADCSQGFYIKEQEKRRGGRRRGEEVLSAPKGS